MIMTLIKLVIFYEFLEFEHLYMILIVLTETIRPRPLLQIPYNHYLSAYPNTTLSAYPKIILTSPHHHFLLSAYPKIILTSPHHHFLLSAQALSTTTHE